MAFGSFGPSGSLSLFYVQLISLLLILISLFFLQVRVAATAMEHRCCSSVRASVADLLPSRLRPRRACLLKSRSWDFFLIPEWTRRFRGCCRGRRAMFLSFSLLTTATSPSQLLFLFSAAFSLLSFSGFSLSFHFLYVFECVNCAGEEN